MNPLDLFHQVKELVEKKDLGTIYQFTPPTTYCIYENIKKGDFQTEIVF